MLSDQNSLHGFPISLMACFSAESVDEIKDFFRNIIALFTVYRQKVISTNAYVYRNRQIKMSGSSVENQARTKEFKKLRL